MSAAVQAVGVEDLFSSSDSLIATPEYTEVPDVCRVPSFRAQDFDSLFGGEFEDYEGENEDYDE